MNSVCIASNLLDEDEVFQDVDKEMQAACRMASACRPRTTECGSCMLMALRDYGTNCLVETGYGEAQRGAQAGVQKFGTHENRRANG